MNFFFRIIAFYLLLGSSVEAQDTIRVNLYKTSMDYQIKKSTSTDVALVTKIVDDKYIYIKKFIDLTTGKKIKKVSRSWALVYNGKTYFNLGYTSDLNNWNIFLKFDLEGKNYCASYINKYSPNIIKNSGIGTGMGLQGLLVNEVSKWGNNWINEKGEKNKILFINLNDIQAVSMSRYKSSRGDFLRRKEIERTFNIDKSVSEIKKISFEKIVQLIEDGNKTTHQPFLPNTNK